MQAASANRNSVGARVHNIRDYGAKGDASTLDTPAVQAAIDACAKDRGGTVLVPAGDFVIGTVEMRSNVTLYLAAAVKLPGSVSHGSYSAGKGVPPGNGNVVLLYAANAENIAIEDPGTIDGQSAKFYIGRGDNTGPGENRAQGYVDRPHLAIFYRCRNVRVRDVFLTSSAYHCMRILECSYVHLDGVRIHNRVNASNDGFHIAGSEYVNIANCNVASQDDACALFGGNRFITVTNSTFSTRWSVFRFGGGQAENIAISNCVIYDTFGRPIKIRVGAGAGLQNISFSNLVMTNVTGPISIGLDSNSRRSSAERNAGDRPKGYVRNVQFNGIQASVVSEGRQFADIPFRQNYRPGEMRTCITLNGVGSEFLENGEANNNIVVDGGDLAKAAAPCAFVRRAAKESVKLRGV